MVALRKHKSSYYRASIVLALACVLASSCRPRSSASIDYDSIRDAKDWQNPFLLVDADAIEIVLPDDRARVPVDKLHDYLSELPGRYWPYGKIVAVSEGGLRPPNADGVIRQNKAQTKQILDSMGIRIKWWNVVSALPPNKSLDASGGSVFLNLLGAAMLE
ncbi:MAG TPA: hypothetical protein VEM96_08990 [Pyrinomonadaceae bacterium]|nr:hypothetical protein [Pyrinomonadaceae bacterium]